MSTFIKKYIPPFSIALLLLVILIYFHFRGITFYDEGYIVNAGLRMVQGQVPYRDFDINYTPISFLATAGFLKLFGISVFAGRLGAFFVSVLSLLALYNICRIFTKNGYLIVFTLLFYTAWGPAHINFPWPTMFAACFLLYTILFSLQALKWGNKKYFFFAGIMAACTFFSKENFGAGIIIASLITIPLSLSKERKTAISFFLYGLLSVSIIALFLFLETSSFFPFIYNMYYHVLEKIVIGKITDTPFLYEGSLLIRSLKLLFYLSPLLYSLTAFFIVRKSHKKLIIAPVLTGIFYLLGIRPVTDYDHLVDLIAVSGISITLIVCFAKEKIIKRVAYFILVALTGLGFHTAVFSGYYKWETPLTNQTYYDTKPYMHIFITKTTALSTNALVTYIDSHTKRGEYIFLNYYAPLVYFLSDRQNVTRFDYMSSPALFLSDQKHIIEQLRDNHVRLVIVFVFSYHEKSIIADYIRRNYRLDSIVDGYYMYLKK